ncbi:nucleoside triphosphate pyrophosphohydrolase [Rickettsiaceae bacterium]|nr:nucleoside triphosphate pyrophosphohydrolase [Rickettsiaceae bacterium]
MIRYPFNKLIRSKLPERMKKEGVIFNSKCLSQEEYAEELKRKLVEEADEVLDTTSKDRLVAELADVMEVINAMLEANSISMEEVEKHRLEKREVNGYFHPDNYINYIDVAKDNTLVRGYLADKDRPYKFYPVDDDLAKVQDE